MSAAQIADGVHARDFILAGNARVTLVSTMTGTRFTYRVNTKPGKPHFVALLTGASNDSDYTFMGTIFSTERAPVGSSSFGRRDYAQRPCTPKYVPGRNSRISAQAPGAKAFAWAWGYLAKGQMPPACEVWHEGRCGRCGRALTVPESIALGLGPECAQHAVVGQMNAIVNSALTAPATTVRTTARIACVNASAMAEQDAIAEAREEHEWRQARAEQDAAADAQQPAESPAEGNVGAAPAEIVESAAIEVMTECSGCEHCDGEGGHSVADSKRQDALAAAMEARAKTGMRAWFD